MEDCGKYTRHFWLTQGMARCVGVNLNEALKTGRLARQDYAETIANCCNCGEVDRCVGWMAASGSGADTAPDYCVIGPDLERLKSKP